MEIEPESYIKKKTMLMTSTAHEVDPRNLKHPFTLLVSAPSQSGKSFWVRKLLSKCRTKISPPIDKIIYVNATVSQDLQDTLVKLAPVSVRLTDNIETVRGDKSCNTLAVVDDLMNDVNVEKELEAIFIRRAHHERLSCIYLVQNLFHGTKIHRTISLNSNYLWIGANRRARDQIRTVAHQMFPGKTSFFLEAYDDATTRQPFGYLFVDLRPDTPEQYRLKTDVLTDAPICYLHKESDKDRRR